MTPTIHSKAPRTAQRPRGRPADGSLPGPAPRKAPKRPRIKAPSEHEEQKTLVELLTLARLDFFACPNGLRCSRKQAAKAKAEGLMAGVPDLHIVTRAPGAPAGAVIEMKRRDGSPSDVSPDQRRWLRIYEDVGVRAFVGYGWQHAVEWLRQLGYPVAAPTTTPTPTTSHPLGAPAAGTFDGDAALAPLRAGETLVQDPDTGQWRRPRRDDDPGLMRARCVPTMDPHEWHLTERNLR